MAQKVPPSAWDNGLHEAIRRLSEFAMTPTTMAEARELPDRLDARDQGALAYVLWRLRNAPDDDPEEPVRAPGKMSEERRAKLTPEEKIFFGIE